MEQLPAISPQQLSPQQVTASRNLATTCDETWVDIIGYEGFYQISNKLRVRSLRKTGNHLLRKSSITKYGYRVVGLCINNNLKMILLHRLIAIHFISNPDNKPQVNHIDGNKLNNNIENLEWCTPGENTRHSRSMGLQKGKRGSESHFYGLSGLKCGNSKILQCTATGKLMNISEGAKYMQVPETTLRRMINGLYFNWTTLISYSNERVRSSKHS